MNKLYLSPPHMGSAELTHVHEAFETNTIGYVGRMITDFEFRVARYLDIPHAVGLSSGTAAMHLVLHHLGISPGDTVFASDFTFIASVSPITFLGATPVFIDCDRQSWNMNPGLLAEALADAEKAGELPKAVIPTDLYGQCVDLDRILAACEPYGIPVIVDSAESLGSEYKGRKSGKGAYASIYSFNGNKIITTSGGGLIASEDDALIEHAKKLATQSRDAVPYYQHTEIGYNYRMSNIAAAIGLGQMDVLDERVRGRRNVFARYQELLSDIPGINFMPETQYDEGRGEIQGGEDGLPAKHAKNIENGEQKVNDSQSSSSQLPAYRSKHNRWLTVMLLDPAEFKASPETLRLALEMENIEARPVWNPMHRQPVFKECKVYGGAVSEDLFTRGLCLPSGTAMTDDDIQRVVEVIRANR